MPPFNNPTSPLVLASGSPRRQQLLRDAGFGFTVRVSQVDESFPADMPADDVALFLARKKADSFRSSLANEIVIAADTTVVLEQKVLNKPATREEAIAMLEFLSERTHVVITGVCILSSKREVSFKDETQVTFRKLTANEIEYYVDTFQPYDKAGAYGIQDWIGMIGINHIQGSYFNVVGLPVHRLYETLISDFGLS